MQSEGQIVQSQDKSFTAFLWLVSLASVYYQYLSLAIIQHIPFGKGIFGLMMIASEILLIVMAVRAYKGYSMMLHPVVRVIALLLIAYNLAHIVYSSIWEDDVAYLSLFGNFQYQPSFMLPFAFLVGLQSKCFFSLYKCIWYYVMLSVPIYILTAFFEPVAGMGILFLLAFAKYLPRKYKISLYCFAVVYITYCYYVDARACVVRALMGAAILLYSYTPLYKSKMVKTIILSAAVIMPLYFIGVYFKTGSSVFEQVMASSYFDNRDDELGADTRTFLYEEVFEDLRVNKAWMYGKGITGTYYSSFFDYKGSLENENRFGVEVGVLFHLLKGGVVQVVLYILLLLAAIYRCLFRSSSKCVVLLGLMLLAHYVLLFIEELPRYDLYNIAIWLCIGLAFALANEEQDDTWYDEQFNLLFQKQ